MRVKRFKPKYDSRLMVAMSLCVDELEKAECGVEAIVTSITMILDYLGYGEVDSYAAAVLVTSKIEEEFRKEFWGNNSFGAKTNALGGAILTAEHEIWRGLDEGIRYMAIDALKATEARKGLEKKQEDS